VLGIRRVPGCSGAEVPIDESKRTSPQAVRVNAWSVSTLTNFAVHPLQNRATKERRHDSGRPTDSNSNLALCCRPPAHPSDERVSNCGSGTRGPVASPVQVVSDPMGLHNEDDETISPVATLKLRPLDTEHGAVTGFRDYRLNSTVDLSDLVSTRFTALKQVARRVAQCPHVSQPRNIPSGQPPATGGCPAFLGADHVLALKGNQPQLYKAVVETFAVERTK